MMADTRTTDELHAAAVRDAVAHLNNVTAAAWKAGLTVELRVEQVWRFDREDAITTVDVSVQRPL